MLGSCFPASFKLNILVSILCGQLLSTDLPLPLVLFFLQSRTIERKPSRNIWVDVTGPSLGPQWMTSGLVSDWVKEWESVSNVMFFSLAYSSPSPPPPRLAWIISNSLKSPSAWKCLVVFLRVHRPSALHASRLCYSPPNHKPIAHPLGKVLRREHSRQKCHLWKP